MAPPLENTAVAAPDFRHVDTWIFDLDNTLYHADTALFAEIEQRMDDFIVRELGFSVAAARALRQRYYRDYGSTLSGLAAHHSVDVEAFLAYVHDIDLQPLVPDEDLQSGIGRLRGRRFVFTNGCRHHARRVLDRTGLTALIDDIWDIRILGLKPKPQPEAYRRIVELGGFSPAAAVLFEDMACNLVPAHALGMTTVWIANDSPWSHQGPQFPPVALRHIHHTTDDLGAFLNAIRL